MTTTNDITGDAIANTKGDATAYAAGWDAIWAQVIIDNEDKLMCCSDCAMIRQMQPCEACPNYRGK